MRDLKKRIQRLEAPFDTDSLDGKLYLFTFPDWHVVNIDDELPTLDQLLHNSFQVRGATGETAAATLADFKRELIGQLPRSGSDLLRQVIARMEPKRPLEVRTNGKSTS
jgi:hypothetical protein